jgi:hypothetical protein
LPQNESQARALAALKPKDQQAVWREFIASGEEMKAENIRKLVRIRIKKGKPAGPKPEDLTGVISDDYKRTVMAMIEQIRLAQNDLWQSTSRQAALFWLGVMKGKILSAPDKDIPA